LERKDPKLYKQVVEELFKNPFLTKPGQVAKVIDIKVWVVDVGRGRGRGLWRDTSQ
jgi:hypothetical protein